MAIPEEDKLWKLRSQHSRDELFASPDLLWAAACEYFGWCDGGFAMREYQRSSSQTVTAADIAGAVREAVQEVKIYTAIEDINEGTKRYTAITESSKF